jgi:nucleoside-diphosphate-sugar epimerase
MICFVTGATGFIGSGLAAALIARGDETRCLVRPNSVLAFPGSEKAVRVTGDLDDMAALEYGALGCDLVFHLAAWAKPWSRDAGLPYRINVRGTVNVLETACRLGVRRAVLTSTAGVFGPSGEHRVLDENSSCEEPLTTKYERTKAEAESKAWEFLQRGLEVVTVNPTRVYGPGPIGESNSLTKIIRSYSRGKWRIIPGDGSGTGNYVFVEDVIRGHILAALKGRSGERYILGGENQSWSGFFETLARVTGKKQAMVKIPVTVMLAAASFLEMQATVTGIGPKITAPFVRKYNHQYRLTSDKAVRELGYEITPLETGLRKTLSWLKTLED